MLRESRRTIQTAIKVKRIIAQMINELDREWKQCENLWLQTRQARNTERAYAQALEDFLVSVKIPIWTADYQDFASWREDMVRRGLKGSTINARLGALNTLFNFACNEYLVENESGLQEPLAKHNPLKMKFLTVKVKQYANSRALSVSEIKRLLGSIDQTTDGGMRDYALLLGYLNLGRRNSE
jgi:site-specific recombinase XerD